MLNNGWGFVPHSLYPFTNKEIKMFGINILLNDSHGVYIPQFFVEKFDTNEWSVRAEDADILKAGPNHEWYWEAWDNALNSAVFTDDDGMQWRLWQDGDLWLYCEQLMTDEEYEAFFDRERETA